MLSSSSSETIALLTLFVLTTVLENTDVGSYVHTLEDVSQVSDVLLHNKGTARLTPNAKPVVVFGILRIDVVPST